MSIYAHVDIVPNDITVDSFSRRDFRITYSVVMVYECGVFIEEGFIEVTTTLISLLPKSKRKIIVAKFSLFCCIPSVLISLFVDAQNAGTTHIKRVYVH